VLGLERDMSLLHRYLTHGVSAKAIPSVRIGEMEEVYWLFARAFFIYADKES